MDHGSSPISHEMSPSLNEMALEKPLLWICFWAGAAIPDFPECLDHFKEIPSRSGQVAETRPEKAEPLAETGPDVQKCINLQHEILPSEMRYGPVFN